MNQQTKAYIFALSAVLLWSTVATAFKIALLGTSVAQLLFFSSLTAFLFTAFPAIPLLKSKSYPKFSATSFGLSAIRGLLNPFLYYLVLFEAYSILPAQEAMSLNYIWPLMLVLLSVPLLKQNIGIWGFIGLIISFLGVLFIATHGNIQTLEFSNAKGAGLAIFSSILWAFFWILNLKSKEPEAIKLFLSFGFGTLFSGIYLFIYEGFTPFDTKTGLSMVYVGIAEMGLTFFLWLKALSLSTRTDKVSRLIYLSPFLSLFFISIFLKEEIGIYSVIGLILIILGIYFSGLKKKSVH